MPFDDIPLDIIQRVFSLCCESVEFIIPQDPERSRSGTTQVTLSLVCSRWRDIVLNTNALWGDVAVIYDASKEREPATASFQFVKSWLDRAGRTPISLYISVFKASRGSQIAAISQTFSSSFRITNLKLESRQCHHLLLPTYNSYYLERLHLTLDGLVRRNYIFPRLPDMPFLKELDLNLRPLDFVDLTNLYLIPWHQLRVLTFSGSLCHWPFQILLDILQRCESLVECTLCVDAQGGQYEHDIVLPNLESLVLDMNPEANVDPIIRSLTVPNLRSLNIRNMRWWKKRVLSPEAIVMMAQRSGFKRLTNFSLCLIDQPVDVRSLLGYMPALESFQLLGPLIFQPGTFGDLSSGTIGPRLEEISFGVMSHEEIGLMLETVGQRHEKAKTVPDIRPFASVTGHCTSNPQFYKRRTKQCGEAFNAHVAIRSDYRSE
ncbi:hypothetical protein JOM56_005192 [Amanita muscaria]